MTTRITILFILFSFISFAQNKCEKYKEEKIVTNLNEALEFIECKWGNEYLNKFKNIKENEEVPEKLQLFEKVRSIGIDLGLWNTNCTICEYFYKLGIFDPDEMSNIIFQSLHRKLNNKEIELEAQINKFKEFQAKLEKEGKDRMKREFSKFKIGDIVDFSYDYYFVSKPNDYCVAQGIIIDKDSTVLKLKVQIKENCENDNIPLIKSKIYEKINGKWKVKEEKIINLMEKGSAIWTVYHLWEEKE